MSLQKLPLLTEKAVMLVINQLRANLNTYIADADNQYSDGISLEPVENQNYFTSEDKQPLKFPCVFVYFGQHAFQYSEKANYLISEDSMIVVLSSEDIGTEVLKQKAWRYGRILYGILNQTQLVDSSSPSRMKIITVPTKLWYKERSMSKLREQEKKYKVDAVLELKAMHYENYLT